MEAAQRDDGVTIFVLIDALGWEILRDRQFLDQLLPERHRLETVLGYSCGAIPTVLTGELPEKHGFWNYFYRSPQSSPFAWTRPLAKLPARLREWRGTRRIIQLISRATTGYRGYFSVCNLAVDRLPYFDLSEKTQIYEPGGLAPSHSLFDELEARKLTYESYTYHTHSDAEILALMPARLEKSNCRVYFLYLSGLDAFLHGRIDDEEGIEEQLRTYERGLLAIDRVAKQRWGSSHWTVFSDHGMTPIDEVVDLMGEVEGLGLHTPGDYLPAYDSTMARFWTESERAREALANLLAARPYGRLLTDEELADLGLSFPDDRYGQLVFLMNPGKLICPSDMGRIPTAGMHGFHPREDPCSSAVYLSSHAPAEPVAHVADILPNLLRTLPPA